MKRTIIAISREHGAGGTAIGKKLSEELGIPVYERKVIELAEKYDKPDVLIHFMDEEKGYVNRVIIALKNIHHEDYLTTLMLSENESLVKSVDRITRGI